MRPQFLLLRPRLHRSFTTMTSQQQSHKKIFAPAPPNATRADQYTRGALALSDLSASPFAQFHAWFTAASDAGVPLPEATALATATLPSGRVSARMVYLKELDARGFVVYSDWGHSRKAADVASNPHASLTFWWRELERQVRVEGAVERLSAAESQVYFDTRARGSRIGAHASRQSEVLPNGERTELEQRVEEVEKRFQDKEDIPVPEFWGGLRIVPDMVEFWQGRESRLHDRFKYSKLEQNEKDESGTGWKIERLNP